MFLLISIYTGVLCLASISVPIETTLQLTFLTCDGVFQLYFFFDVCEKTALKAAEMVGIPRLSVVNVVGSAIARETKMGVYLNAGRETAVASTKAFTTQVRG